MTKKKKPEDKEKVGRPTILTPPVVNKLEQAFSMGCSDLEACFYADISKQTLYNYQAKHPEFVDRKERLKERMIFRCNMTLQRLYNIAQTGQTAEPSAVDNIMAQYQPKQEGGFWNGFKNFAGSNLGRMTLGGLAGAAIGGLTGRNVRS